MTRSHARVTLPSYIYLPSCNFIITHLSLIKSHNSSVDSVHVTVIIKNGSMDNAIQQLSLAFPSWYVSHNNAMVYKYGKQTR